MDNKEQPWPLLVTFNLQVKPFFGWRLIAHLGKKLPVFLIGRNWPAQTYLALQNDFTWSAKTLEEAS